MKVKNYLKAKRKVDVDEEFKKLPEITYTDNLFEVPEIKDEGIGEKVSRLTTFPSAESGTPRTEPKTTQQSKIESSDVSVLNPPIPKWHKRALRKQWREHKILHLVDIYKNGIRGFTPEQKDVDEYEKELRAIKPKDLNTITEAYTFNKQGTGLIDVVKKLDSKYSCLVHILMDNNTLDTIIVNERGRSFKRHECMYILDKDKGKQYKHKKLKMTVYFYFQNNPFPVTLTRNVLPVGMPDGILLKKTMHFEYLQALANSIKMAKKIEVLVFIGILAFILNVIILLVCLKGFGIIGKG